MSSKATNRFCLAGKFQITQIAVRGTTVRNKNCVVEVKDNRHSLSRDQTLEERRSQQCGLTKNVDSVKLPGRIDHREPAGKAARNVRELAPHVSRLIEQLMQLFVFERRISDLNA